jgi:signal transduction histidine kinase/DNA-binding response OmpR family regulator
MAGASLGNGHQTELRFLVDKNADGIVVVDESGTVRFANAASGMIFGRAPESLVGTPVGIPLVTGETTEITIHKPGGDQVDAEIRVVDTSWDDRPALLASIRDISARKVLEEQLRHTSKMEAIGRLTAGIAHDFNNLLTVVLGNLEHAQRRTEESSLLKRLDNAMRGARRAAILTERLLAFARRKPLEPKPVNANSLISGMSELLQQTRGETINVRTMLAEDLWTIEIDPTELETAILNLVVNARDAMPAGGDVIIETSNVELDANYAATDIEVTPGPYVQIAVTDMGTGMTPDILRQVFEPFFTTKADGRGTGLGLSQVYGFVKQSGGHIKLYSEPGQGTTAKIYLPKTNGTPEAPSKDGEDLPPGARAHETVLVVEDDEDVRNYTVSSLRDLGYRVFDATDGPSALEILEREPDIGLLFTDLGLPGGMDGKALASQATQRRPELRVLITTAYAGKALVHEGRLDRGVDLLSKPFTFSALALRIREMLDRGPACDTTPSRILVVDDEALLQMLVVDVLEAAGCQSETASSFLEAIAKFQIFAAELSAAILDVGLPDRSGEELAAEIRRARPDLPIILATGFADDGMRRRYSADPKISVVTKPFDPDALVKELRRLGARC